MRFILHTTDFLFEKKVNGNASLMKKKKKVILVVFVLEANGLVDGSFRVQTETVFLPVRMDEDLFARHLFDEENWVPAVHREFVPIGIPRARHPGSGSGSCGFFLIFFPHSRYR